MRIRFRILLVAFGLCAGLLAKPSFALTFNVAYDASVSSAPTGFSDAFSYATGFLEAAYTDPITINLAVGWGEINGFALQPGNLGQNSSYLQSGYGYDQVRNALAADAKTASDAQAVGNLPAADPSGGLLFQMTNAEAKALGLLAGNAPGLDGYIGFLDRTSYSFDPNHRAAFGQFDFVGLALHEITEVMGRLDRTLSCGYNCATVIDLFRYSGVGKLALNPTYGAYFSTDAGATNINTFNGPGGGDLTDWAGLTSDSFNSMLQMNAVETYSPGDFALMDVIGYDHAAPVPEPGTWVLMPIGVGIFGVWAKRRRVIGFRSSCGLT